MSVTKYLALFLQRLIKTIKMNNFKYKNPTKILFGKGEIRNLSKEIPANAKILMLYGGGSIKRNGIYEQVIEALKGYRLCD